ncbi:MAG: hypothetical protein OXD30_06090, partial [Bryobacterales bacterium]|nr:hypothetical protein [Bryobacterales bacterium]
GPAMGSGAFLVEACRQLGDALVDAWAAAKARPHDLADEDEVTVARRAVAQRGLYGVDRNVVAVDLAKMSLWLITLAKRHPLTFVDHALRHGDSLLGLRRDQIEWFHWHSGEKGFQPGIEFKEVMRSLERVSQLRKRIQDSELSAGDQGQRELWGATQDELGRARLLGDLLLGAFFEGGSPKGRDLARSEYSTLLLNPEADDPANPLDELRHEAKPLASFHWEIEFPEAFERSSSGFDCIIGNPPFAGKNSVIGANADGYTDWLKAMHPASHGNADLAAHFFRRSFSLLRQGGNLGLVATNTIAQGDTRSTGLRQICHAGGEIYDATRRLPWPGMAAVIVSVVHIHRGAWSGKRTLDGTELDSISAYLSAGSTHNDPARLAENEDQSFQGSIVLGMGFTFDDTDKKGVASSLADMQRLVEENPKNAEAILPYIGGEELNSHPAHAHHRHVINFHDYPLKRDPNRRRSWFKASEKTQKKWVREGVVPWDYPRPVAEDWPELLGIVRDKVKPDRIRLKDKGLRSKWWQFARTRPELNSAIQGLNRVLAISGVGQHVAFAFLRADMVYSNALMLFPFASFAAFCVLQSRLHAIWARCFGSSMKDDLRYTPTDCFETFPFPRGWATNPYLEEAGRAYYKLRSALMQRHGEGLTKTYNRFHDRDEDDPDIARLRQLHDAMDLAVLAEYGWEDIPLRCEFLSDLESEEESTSKRFWRYRWPDEIRDDVLGRLIELNSERAREEQQDEDATTAAPAPRLQAIRTSRECGQADPRSSPASPTLFKGDAQ